MTETKKYTVSRTINAPVAQIWDVLSNPELHKEFDSSGRVRSDEKSDRIQATDQVFTMNMEGPNGAYKTDNHVVGYNEHKLLAWATAPAGQDPLGWQWVWELNSVDDSTTEVSLTYDWSQVSDEVQKNFNPPLLDEKELEGSLANLAVSIE